MTVFYAYFSLRKTYLCPKSCPLENFEKLLNPVQLKAVTYPGGPMMIVAGAGSGKTRVLTYRIAWLMTQGVDPFNILALTFTNKAANEMKERIAQVVGESEARNIWMGTFHSIFARILRVEADRLGYSSGFSIYDQEDSLKAIRQVISEMGLDKDIYKPKQIAARISIMKNNLITPKVYEKTYELMEQDALARREKFAEVYRKYNEKLFRSNAMDFDDLLLKTNELFALYPEVLAKYQNKFQHILVDEYQDTNHAQYLIIRALASRHRNICVVGDDSQSIYSFRGANIRNILNFQKDYPDAVVFKLEQNYRSTKNIVGAGNSLIEKNKQKIDKTLWTANDTGEKIRIVSAFDENEEARLVAQDIAEKKLEKHFDNADFAILYRTNSQSRALEQALRNYNIPYRIYGGLSFYQRKEIKDVLAYLRLMENPKDEEALRRIINFPARGIGQTTMDKITVTADKHGVSLFEVVENPEKYRLPVNAGTIRKLKDFAQMILSFRVRAKQNNVYELTKEILKKVNFSAAYAKEGAQEAEVRMENIQELLNAMKDFLDEQRELENGDTSLTSFLQNVALYSNMDEKDDNPDKVTLMTVHMAKGLEFPVVYITGMEENLFPSAMSLTSREDLEEERRLFYVAVTRAKQYLTITYAQMRHRWGQIHDAEPSRFLDEIDDQFVERADIERKLRAGNFLDPDIFDRDLPFRNKSPRPSKRKDVKISATLQSGKLKPLSSVKKGKGDAEPLHLAPGMRVRHGRFGKGTVLELSGDGDDKRAKIKFDNTGVKTLILRFARLEIIDK